MFPDGYLILIVIGAIGGLMADALVSGTKLGFIGAIVIGVLGAFIGNWLFDKLNLTFPGSPLFISIATAFLGAVVMLMIIRGLSRA